MKCHLCLEVITPRKEIITYILSYNMGSRCLDNRWIHHFHKVVIFILLCSGGKNYIFQGQETCIYSWKTWILDVLDIRGTSGRFPSPFRSLISKSWILGIIMSWTWFPPISQWIKFNGLNLTPTTSSLVKVSEFCLIKTQE